MTYTIAEQQAGWAVAKSEQRGAQPSIHIQGNWNQTAVRHWCQRTCDHHLTKWREEWPFMLVEGNWRWPGLADQRFCDLGQIKTKIGMGGCPHRVQRGTAMHSDIEKLESTAARHYTWSHWCQESSRRNSNLAGDLAEMVPSWTVKDVGFASLGKAEKIKLEKRFLLLIYFGY